VIKPGLKLWPSSSSQVVTLGSAHRPRTGGDLRQLAIIEDSALWCAAEFIEAARPAARNRNPDLLNAVIDAGRRVLMPGFVDARTHPVFAGIARTSLSNVRPATHSEIAVAEADSRHIALNAQRAQPIWSKREDDTPIGFCAPAPQQLKRNPIRSDGEDELKILRAIKQLNEETPTLYPTFRRSAIRHWVRIVAQHVCQPGHQRDAAACAKKRLAECDVFCEEGVFTTDESRQILSGAFTRVSFARRSAFTRRRSRLN
jgi:imidazolonepropionase